MKKSFLLLIAAFVLLPLCNTAQTKPMLWPVSETDSPTDKSGDFRVRLGILYTPQSYIGGELNFDNIFITAPEGTPVVSPADGIIETFGLTYMSSLTYQIYSQIDAGADVVKEINEFAKKLKDKEDPRFIHITVGIRLADGRKIYLSGLKSGRVFKTGEKVTRGQLLGTVWYSYHKVKEPSIILSISDPRGKSADPMTPFGIPSTFIALAEMPAITEMTGDQAREDFTVLMEVLREAYPGLYDVLTPEELEEFCHKTLASFPEKVPIHDFYYAIKRTVGTLHDSHLYLYPLESERQRRSIDLPEIYFGWVDSAMIAVRTTKPYAAYYGRHIRSVDGIPADSLSGMVIPYIGRYDAKVQSLKNYFLALGLSNLYFDVVPQASRKCDVTLEFEDGEKLSLKGWTYKGRGDTRGLGPNWTGFMRINYYPKDNFALRRFDDSTAYIGLSTFQLNRTEIDSIASFIRSIADKPNLIFDVRNNGGGEVKVVNELLSYFTDKPYVKLNSYQMVPKQGHYKSFVHCMNYMADQDIFATYQPEEGREGFYSYEDTEILPDSTTHYGGRLYVLINENSCSAATIFPAMILRNHRGMIVGRETATAYHFMNALKFADIRLPHSWLTVRVPLVRCVFDTTRNPRIPYGRGVLPDHEITLSLDEIYSVRGDSILNYTLALIERGEYLGEDPFAVTERPTCHCQLFAWIAAVIVFMGGLFWFLRRKK